MVTDSAQHQSIPPTRGVLARAGEQVRQFICGLHGHDALLHFEKERLSLMCTSCGHETPGWDVTSGAGRPERLRRVVGMPLVSQRRIA
jgi:hypothetical protein